MPLVPVHGGLDAPVNRYATWKDQKSMLAEAASLPRIVVSDGDLSVVHRIADGTLSPLTGFMTESQYNQVLDSWTVTSGGKNYAWAIPLALPVTEDEAAKLAIGGQAAMVDTRGKLVGFIRVESRFAWNKQRYVEKTYLTARLDHPGAAIATDDARTTLVGGEIRVLPQPRHGEYADLMLAPSQTRALIAARQWQAALAFQTRNPLHRAHEYALVYGVESLTRSGLYAGVVLNPLVGQLKNDDVDASTRVKTYRMLRDRRLLGEGDSDRGLWEGVGYELNDVFELICLDMKMFYGGPAEAIMHSIYRQNHGFSHIVIGRKHADAPYFDKSAIWGDFDAQQIFEKLPGELHTRPVKVGFAAYYDSMGRVDLTENHKGEEPYSISGTRLREQLVGGERPDPRIIRGDVADVLIEAYRKKAQA
ncbi:MAG: sulfate adenylyltransferase [Deltaproteobacteria bacterium]|nr:sulfate adenylyltransferase [Deltaproteobacteria bacterium]